MEIMKWQDKVHIIKQIENTNFSILSWKGPCSSPWPWLIKLTYNAK